MDSSIDTGDHIFHTPSGEEWLVAYVRGDYLVCCGWPESSAKLSDCTLLRKAEPHYRLALLQDMATVGGARGAYAQQRLRAGEQPAP